LVPQKLLLSSYEEWTLETYAEQIIGLHAGCTGLQTSHAIVGYDWAQKAKIADTAIVGLLGNTLTGDFLGLENDLELREEQVLNTLVGNKNNELIEKYFREEIGFICDEILNRWKNLKKEISPVQSLLKMVHFAMLQKLIRSIGNKQGNFTQEGEKL
jgi:hypothetical protein